MGLICLRVDDPATQQQESSTFSNHHIQAALQRGMSLLLAALGLGPARRFEALAAELDCKQRELHTAREATRVARELAERKSALERNAWRVMSHELRGPLTTLRLLLARAQKEGNHPPTSSERAVHARMSATVERLAERVESLLSHAALESGLLTTRGASFGVAEIAADVLEELRPSASAKGIELSLDIAPDLPPLYSDATLVRLILTHLLSNAVKFTEQGSVQMSLAALDGCHQFAVADSGVGIPVQEQLRIFEPFAHVDPVREKHLPGMGLGLTLVREVATALGGSVSVASQVGRGSTFTVVLPPLPASPPPSQAFAQVF